MALRRPKLEQQPQEEEIVFPAAVTVDSSLRYPRWAVVSGVILYCSIFWLVVWFAGGWVLSLIHSAGAAQ